MAHTNSTTHYSLPQFVTSDKPAWLTDVNGAMSAIDTGIYDAQTKANTADGNATQALSDAADAQSTANTADGKGSGAVASIAPAFDNTATYSVGDYVMYNNLLYKCRVAITVPGAWTGSTNWNRATVDDMNTAMDLRMDAVETATTPVTPSYAITKSSGAWNVSNISQKQDGKVVHMSVSVIGSGEAVQAGSNGFVGLLNFTPPIRSSGVAFVGAALVMIIIETNGTVYIRPLIGNTNWSSSDGVTIPITFMA